MSDPQLAIAAIESRARIVRTPTGTPCELAWRVWDGPPGARTTLVLLHGSFGSWTHWLLAIERLSAQFRIVAVDLPGFGDSDDAPDDRSPPAIARLLRDGLDAGRDALLADTRTLCVGGFSLGAVYAGWLARMLVEAPLAAPAPALRLLLVSPGGLGPRDHPLPPTTRIERDADDAARHAAHRKNLASVMFGDPATIDALALAVQDANVARARFRGSFTSRSDFLLDALRALAMPVLAVWGDRDAFDPDVRVRVAALRSVQPEAPTVVLAGAGHWVPWEAVARFVPAVTDWLEHE
jgi:pimeloyl-ACP methyl ester carboxylesterase